MKFVKLIKAKNNLKDLSDKICLEVCNFMEENFNPFEADSYEDAVNFCKTLTTKPSYYLQDNYENLLDKKIIDENIIKKNGKNSIIKIIKDQLKDYGKDALKDVKSDRENWDNDFEEEDW